MDAEHERQERIFTAASKLALATEQVALTTIPYPFAERGYVGHAANGLHHRFELGEACREVENVQLRNDGEPRDEAG
jgi:hypothetical protein